MRKLPNLFKPSPFKAGCLVILAAAVLYYSFGQNKPELLTALDNQIINAMFRMRGPESPSGKVIIVDIDEKSLKAVGQWPWPRNIVAELVRSISAENPRSIGFDIVFAEKDRSSPAAQIDRLADFLPEQLNAASVAQVKDALQFDHDRQLGEVVSRTPVVLGYVFQMKDDGLKDRSAIPFPSAGIRISPPEIDYADLSLITGYRAIMNIPEISLAPSEGFFNVFPDPSGTVRRAPLLMLLDGIPYPSLALEMVRSGSNIPDFTIHAASPNGENTSLLGISLGQRFIPTDDRGQLVVNFRGPVGRFTYIPAAEVLEGLHRGRFRDAFVIIGSSAAGLLDVHATPFSPIFPGVEVQATIIDNLLAGDPLSYDVYTEIGLTYTLIIAGGLILSLLLAYSGALAGGLAGLVFILIAISGNYWLFFLNNRLVGLTYPLACIVAVFITVTLFNYFFEYRRKRFLHEAFSHYVSPHLVSEIIRRPEKLALAGEQKDLTVLFSDIRGFTSISEKMAPDALGSFMNTYLSEMSTIVMDHHGMVDKYIGDAVMAIWGAPLDDADQPANAARASLAMLKRLDELRPTWTEQGLPAVEIGIGINSGPVSVGNFGSFQRFDYTVIGDNVNLASRLEGLNKTYGSNLIITEATLKMLDDNFFCRPLDLVRVKGKNEPVAILEPLCEGQPPEKLRLATEYFRLALNHYRQRNFDEAWQILWELNEKSPQTLYRLYLERIREFRVNPPEEDWDGTFTFTTK